jgi:NTP pyrophosphatase (non-canonical NTP hydrolase)
MNRNEEIMTILQEECAEVIQAVSKVKRFGLEGNVKDLKKELCDLQCMINLMEEFNVISYNFGDRYEQIQKKRQKLQKFSRIFESNS